MIDSSHKLVSVCLTPELIHQHQLDGYHVVVVDILRATSCMVSGLAHGVSAIYPVKTVDECLELGRMGMLTAGERGGVKIPEFDMGNSPFEYQAPGIEGREVAVSTTNGTQAIMSALDADEILIGAFLNITSTARYLRSHASKVLIYCAGWKGTPNLEDTLYAGALIDLLLADFAISGDSALVAHSLFLQHQHDLLGIAQRSGHAQRLAGFGVIKDIAFCVKYDVYDIVCRLEENKRLVAV